MAITEIRPAVCMACGHKQSVLDVRQINVQKRPEIKQKILQGTLFPMHCRACGAVLEKVQNCLYIDPALPLLLELAAPGEPCRLQEVQEGLGDTKAIIRVVRTPEDMAEIRDLIEEFCTEFSYSMDKIMEKKFYVLVPNSKNPYKQLYTYN